MNKPNIDQIKVKNEDIMMTDDTLQASNNHTNVNPEQLASTEVPLIKNEEIPVKKGISSMIISNDYMHQYTNRDLQI